MFGYIYKTTNLINNKIYIGQHKNSIYNPEYLGSGKLILRAIKKYGKDNFSNEIIHICSNKEELCNMEKYYIKKFQSFPKTNKGYNLTPGGEFGDCTFGMTDEQLHEYKLKFTGKNNGMYGRKLEESSINKMVETRKKNGVGRKPIKIIFKNGNEKIFNSKKECMESLNINQKVIDRLLKTNKPYQLNKNTNKNKLRFDLVGLKARWA